ncbi:BLOC-1-related complex subunit 8 isoform X2 [Pseudophryne corroboree]|uniref:BLOC-1-related complex subunit 8 isoform X2 n=1 Tax=Pseudophryne corroboree TaxID=495146 RepID=UPI0030817114
MLGELGMEEQEMQIKVKKVTDKFTESMYVLANEPSVALYRLQEHVRRSLPELAQHKADMQNWEEQSQGSIYTVEYACSAVKSMTFSSVHFKSIDGLLKQAINLKHQLNTVQSRSMLFDKGVNGNSEIPDMPSCFWFYFVFVFLLSANQTKLLHLSVQLSWRIFYLISTNKI